MNVGILCDPIPESTDDPEQRVIHGRWRATREGVRAALQKHGHTPVVVPADETIFERLHAHQIDIGFNVFTGTRGDSPQSFVPSVLDMLGIPYTGSGVLAHSVALDKPTTKSVLQAAGIHTPPFQVFAPGEGVELDPLLSFPLFVKPSRSGSSLGITGDSLVRTEEELARAVHKVTAGYHQPALVEEFVRGREFTLGILGNDPATVLPILEVDFGDLPDDRAAFRTFGTKFLGEGSAKSTCPALLDSDQANRLKETALAAYRAVGCCDFARVDIRLDADAAPQVLEINSLPRLAPDGGSLGKMASVAGLAFDELIQAILVHACKRYGMA